MPTIKLKANEPDPKVSVVTNKGSVNGHKYDLSSETEVEVSQDVLDHLDAQGVHYDVVASAPSKVAEVKVKSKAKVTAPSPFSLDTKKLDNPTSAPASPTPLDFPDTFKPSKK